MTPVNRIVLALGALCLAVIIGSACAHRGRANRHYQRMLYAVRNEMPEKIVSEYHRLPRKYRLRHHVKVEYDEARKHVTDHASFDCFPTMEPMDLVSLFVFFCGFLGLWRKMTPKSLQQSTSGKAKDSSDVPTEGQMAFIRRINNGIVPIGLTRTSAAAMISSHLSRVVAESKAQQVDISPLEFMSGSKSYREKAKLERDRKRAQEKVAKQQEQERRLREREAQKAQKAADRLYDRRMAEEEKLFKVREEAHDGISHKVRNAKAQTIQEFQQLVNGILADNRIEPQEVRQLKAWLLANRQDSNDFSQMLKVIDESLIDGIIDADETQAIYEGAIDCLITLRDRRIT